MRRDMIMTKRVQAIAIAAVGCLALSLAAVRPSAADSWDSSFDSGWDSGWDDDGWYEERMQDNAIASAEESAREAGRAIRRDEIAKEQAAKSAAHEEYFESVMAQSKASLDAPKGMYYRKPGYQTSSPPGTAAETVAAGPITLLYEQGVFWFQRGDAYVVVVPPAGAVVSTIPSGVRVVPTKSGTYLYYFGVFFTAKGGKYTVVKPPANTIVGYLPDGYTEEAAGDGKVFKFGDASYKQVFVQGVLAYQVI